MKEINEKKYTPVEIETVKVQALQDPGMLVASSEEYYNNQVMAAATTIRENMPRYRFILLCGPSASGKTTTAHKLKHRLIAQGVGARVVSMDNFFLGMDSYPKLADGSPDMESFEALDRELLNRCFGELMETGQSLFPLFDFETQTQRLKAHHMELGENDVLIMEGIHALNPRVLSNIAQESIFRIYVSVRTKFVEGDETVLVPKDIRLIRRMVRDHKFRNHSPVKTLQYWKHVVAGEKMNIDLYRDDVNLKMDNTIDYEVCVWRHILRDLLTSVEPGSYHSYPELARIFAGLTHFPEIDCALIPKNSLLREFVGEDL
jgi:uridine kinase